MALTINNRHVVSTTYFTNKGILASNNIIKYDSAKSVVKLAIGSEIKLTQADFARLSKAFFEEIETKFTLAARDAR